MARARARRAAAAAGRLGRRTRQDGPHDALHLTLATRSDPALELWALRRNAALFKQRFGLDVVATHQPARYAETPWIL